MNKVYINEKEPYWFLSELTDIYLFKTSDFKTGVEKNIPLSWTRGFNIESLDNVIRVYDVEINDKKYYFLVSLEDNIYKLRPENNIELEKLLNDTNIKFIGEKLENSDL